jgi:hypothetical protein
MAASWSVASASGQAGQWEQDLLAAGGPSTAEEGSENTTITTDLLDIAFNR